MAAGPHFATSNAVAAAPSGSPADDKMPSPLTFWARSGPDPRGRGEGRTPSFFGRALIVPPEFLNFGKVTFSCLCRLTEHLHKVNLMTGTS